MSYQLIDYITIYAKEWEVVSRIFRKLVCSRWSK